MTAREQINSYTDTGKTIVHQGRTYAILNPPPESNLAEAPFILRSEHGQYYALIRNAPSPHQFFAIRLFAGKFTGLPGFFSNESGELVSLG